MRAYTAKNYQRLVEESNDEGLRNYMRQEEDFIRKINNTNERTFIDLGAGHGRVVPLLVNIARNVIAIELNPDMYHGLQERAQTFPNVVLIEGNLLQLSDLLDDQDVKRPIFLLLQNSLGTIEGDYKKALKAARDEAKERQGDIVLSLFRQKALKDWGIEMYASIADMIGRPDLSRTDFNEGIFRSDTGYESKWWRNDDIASLISFLGGQIADELRTNAFYLLRVSYNLSEVTTTKS